MTMVWAAWAIVVSLAAWNNGLKSGKMPPPYTFIMPTVLFGGISLLARWNGRIAGLLALGLVLPMVLLEFQYHGQIPANVLKGLSGTFGTQVPTPTQGSTSAWQSPLASTSQYQGFPSTSTYWQRAGLSPAQIAALEQQGLTG
jgi:hypothetical protein